MLKMKNAVFVLLILSILSGFTGCRNATKSTVSSGVNVGKLGDTGGLVLPIDKKGTKVSIFVESSVSDFENKLFVKALSEVTGLNIEIIAVPSSNVAEKFKMLSATKNLPDVSLVVDGGKILDDLSLNGALVPIDMNLDKMPNIKKLYKDTPENRHIFADYGQSDGHLYTIPNYDTARDLNHGLLYRKDIFDKNNIKPWTNTEEFYQALKKLKEIYPESLPFASKYQVDTFANWSTLWGIDSCFGEYFDEDSKIWRYSAIDPKFKDMLDFMKKLYDEKLLDNEFLTCTQASWTAKMTQENKSFVTFDWIDRMDMFYDQVKETNPDYDLRIAMPIGAAGKYKSLGKIGDGFIIVADNNKKDLSLKLVDFLFSQAGASLSTLGVEGESYKIDGNGKVSYLGFDEDKTVNVKDLEDKYGLFVNGASPRYDSRCAYFQYSPKIKEAQDMVKEKNLLLPVTRIVKPIPADKNKATDLWSALDKEARVFASKYVTGNETGDAAWEAWVKKAKELGADELTDIHNRGQKAYEEMQKTIGD